ncbi:hypothetical protein [uncultured Rhodospira sp.]|uniref:hypothetical protein n=1 Tax=uncultured Rhodospira sp. TaxID=1936189 RepID=UPI0026260BDB|nr:hypothetical protein [uncultured Rhodospira sp.]
MLVNGTAPDASALASQMSERARRLQTSLDSHENPLIAIVDVNDPSQAKAMEDDLALSEDAIGRLEAAEQEMREARKEAARQKLERLKAQLQALRMLAANDPEAAAREAARLARQLASAVREYVSAGGDASEAASATGAPPPSVPTPSNDDGASVERDAGSGAAGSDPIDTAVAASNAEAADRRADAAFVNDARLVRSGLKAIIEEAQRRKEDDPLAADIDTTAADRTLTAVDAMLAGQAATPDTTPFVPSVTLLV